jgi:hypothetical protein
MMTRRCQIKFFLGFPFSPNGFFKDKEIPDDLSKNDLCKKETGYVTYSTQPDD